VAAQAAAGAGARLEEQAGSLASGCSPRIFQPGFFISRDRSGGKRGGDDLMAQPLRTRRRALTVLAAAMNGRTEAFMTVRGFSPDLIAGLISAGLASTHVEHIVKGQRTMEVVRVRITSPVQRELRRTKKPPRGCP
jgi:hypothetical protein